MDNEKAFRDAVFRMRTEDSHGGHAEEHRQEMIDIANAVVKQYVNTTLMQTIRQMVDEVIAQKLQDFETAQVNIDYNIKSTVAKQAQNMIKDFERELEKAFKKNGLKVTFR